MNEHRKRGQLEALQGKPRYYGCHFGMRSSRTWAMKEYYEGWDEVSMALELGDDPQSETVS